MSQALSLFVNGSSWDLGGNLLTFEERAAPADWIRDAALAFEHVAHIPDCQVIPSFRILREDIFEPLRYKSTFRIVRSGVASMLVLMYVFQKDAEERIWQPARTCWV